MAEAESTQSISDQLYVIETDLSSNCPLHYLSVVAKYFLPIDLVNDISIQRIIECGVSEGYAKAQVNRGSKVTEIATGCSAEGLVIPDFLDTSTNSWRLSPDMEKVKVMCNEFVENSDLTHDQQEMKPKCQTEDTCNGGENQVHIKYTEEYSAFRKSLDPNYNTECLSHDDVLTECLKDKRSDDSLVVEFKSWPRVAIPWIVRARPSGWPSSDVKVAVVQGGCHVTPVSGTENKEGKLWEYAFYNANRHLAHSLSRDQRQVFLLFNIVHMYYIETPDILTHEHFRTVFFWMLERIPSDHFYENNLGKMLLQLLNELALALASGKLEHYFIPEINLFEDIPSDHCQTLWKEVKWVSSNIIQVILDLNQKLQFSGVGFKIDLQHCFSEHILNLKDNTEDELTFYNALISGCFKMIDVHLSHLEKLHKGRPNNEKKAQINLLINMCMQALWDIKCYSEEADDFPSDLHCAIYTLGYFNDKAKVIARLVLHLGMKAGVDKQRTVGCTEDIVHYCRSKQNIQRAVNLLQVRQSMVQIESEEQDESENSRPQVQQSIKQC